MTNIPAARAIIEEYLKGTATLNDLRQALDMMTRTVVKRTVHRGIRTTPEAVARTKELLGFPLTDTEIAERAFGHASAAGRVSEIRRGLR